MTKMVCKFKRRLNFFSINSSMIASFVMLIFIIVLFVSMISYNYTINDFERISINYTQMLISEINDGLDSYINNMKSMAEVIVENKDVKKLMGFYATYNGHKLTPLQEQQLQEMRYDTSSHLNLMKNTRNDITNIAVISKYNDVLLSDIQKQLNPYSKFTVNEWYKKPMSNKYNIIVSPSHVQNLVLDEYKWVISISKAITDSKTGEITGVMVIDLNYHSIEGMCENAQLNNSGYIYIVDNYKNFIYHPQQQLIYSGIKSELTDKILNMTNSFLRDKNSNKIYIKNYSRVTGWSAIGVINSNKLIKNPRKTINFYIWLALIAIVFASSIAVIISNAITKPIKRLEHIMHKVENGNLNVESDIKLNNEIGHLSNTFNVMIAKTKLLMEKAVSNEEEKRKSEIYALQAQINPHFLYNTLDTIIWMSAAGKNKEVVEITSALAQLFRTSISKGGSLSTLANEIENINSYLTIQKERYEDKLTYSVEIPKELENLMTPKLILQPIVENSIYHGLKLSPSGGVIKINAHCEDQKLILTVDDSGIGMSDEQIENLLVSKDDSDRGIGIINVHNRIKLCFGEEYGLHYKSELQKGTHVEIWLPIIKGGEAINV